MKAHCMTCGREADIDPDDCRTCFSFGGLDPRKELMAGRFVDPCRGHLLIDGEDPPPPPDVPSLELKIMPVDVNKTYKVCHKWKP